MKPQRLLFLDTVRGLAALAVCAGHLRASMLPEFSAVPNANFLTKLFYLITGLGHQAVIVFFVLSGYLVGGAVLKNVKAFSWLNYTVSRLSRLWMVLVPSLVFTYACDRVTQAINPSALEGAYASVWNSGPMPGSYDATLLTFLGNVLFLQTIFVNTFGSNGPLWSLANEFWYYVMFPLLLKTAVGSSGSERAICAALLIGMLLALPWDLVAYGLCWLIGAVTWQLTNGAVTTNSMAYVRSVLSGILFAAVLIAMRIPGASPVSSPYVKDLILALSFASFLFFTTKNFKVSSKHLDKILCLLSDISYTLYLFHFPVVIFLGGVILKGERLPWSLSSLSIWVICLLGVLALSYLAWFAFERNTEALRRYLLRIPERQ